MPTIDSMNWDKPLLSDGEPYIFFSRVGGHQVAHVRIGKNVESMGPQEFVERIDEWADEGNPYLARRVLFRLAIQHGAKVEVVAG